MKQLTIFLNTVCIKKMAIVVRTHSHQQMEFWENILYTFCFCYMRLQFPINIVTENKYEELFNICSAVYCWNQILLSRKI